MPIDYATAGERLETFGRAWQTFDGDLIVSLFTEDAEYHADAFGPPMVGHNAIRAYWLDGANTTEQVEFTVERHWVSGDTVLAAWHASYVEKADRRAGAPRRVHDLGDGRRRTDRLACANGPYGPRRRIGRVGERRIDGRRHLVRRRQRLRRTGAAQRARPGAARGRAALRLQGRHRRPDPGQGRDRRSSPTTSTAPAAVKDLIESKAIRREPVAQDLRLGQGRAGRRQQGPPGHQAAARPDRGGRQADLEARSATSSPRSSRRSRATPCAYQARAGTSCSRSSPACGSWTSPFRSSSRTTGRRTMPGSPSAQVVIFVVAALIVLSLDPVGHRLPAGVLTQAVRRPAEDTPLTMSRARRRNAARDRGRGRRPLESTTRSAGAATEEAPTSGRAGRDPSRPPSPRMPAAEPADAGRRGRCRGRTRGRWPPVGPRTVGRFIADALRAAGVRYAFTVPGESFLGLLDALGDAGIRVVATRHEGGAAFMAEAHGQLTGRPAACLATRAVGGANLAIGIHTARQDSSPMFAIVGQVERDFRGREAFQEIDQVATLGGLAKWAVEPRRAEDVPAAMAAGRARGADRPTGPGAALAARGPPRRGDRARTGRRRPPGAGTGDRRRHPRRHRAARLRPAAGDPGGRRRPARANLDRAGPVRRAAPGPGRSRPGAAATSSRTTIRCTSGMAGLGAPPSIRQRLADADAILVLGSRLNEATTYGYTLPLAGHALGARRPRAQPIWRACRLPSSRSRRTPARSCGRPTSGCSSGAVLDAERVAARDAHNAADRATWEADTVVDDDRMGRTGRAPGPDDRRPCAECSRTRRS